MSVLDGLSLPIDEHAVLRLQGYVRASDQPSARVRGLLVQALEMARTLARPAAYSAVFEIQRQMNGELILANDARLHVGGQLRRWEGAESLAAALCTIGPDLEREVEVLFAVGDFPLAMMLDATGSVAVEGLARQMQESICASASERGWRTGVRLAPGYGDWDVSDQTVLFSLLAEDTAGIVLNEQAIMWPRKSVSFCLGLGPGVKPVDGSNACDLCTMPQCRYRIMPARADGLHTRQSR